MFPLFSCHTRNRYVVVTGSPVFYIKLLSGIVRARMVGFPRALEHLYVLSCALPATLQSVYFTAGPCPTGISAHPGSDPAHFFFHYLTNFLSFNSIPTIRCTYEKLFGCFSAFPRICFIPMGYLHTLG